jgi:subtilisin family serine protease
MKIFTLRQAKPFATICLLVAITSVLVKAQVPITDKKLRIPPHLNINKDNLALGADLLALHKEYNDFHTRKNARAIFQSSNPILQLRDGFVVVEAVASGDPLTLLHDLEALGMKEGVVFGRMVSGLLPIGVISQTNGLQSMRFLQPSYQPVTNVGLVNSQGDSATRANIARKNFGVTGKGSKVGVLSDSYNNLTGAKLAVLSGDLPGEGNPNGFTKPVQVLSDLPSGRPDEGRAMLEIVHDMAPGAELAFHTAFNGQADFAQGIVDLASAGCNIILDDVFYFAEPFFQDGIINQAIDLVASAGVTYFSAAGNHQRDSYESHFQPSGSRYVKGEAHSFAEGDEFQSITIPVGATAIISFQWNQPFYSVTGNAGAETDMDIYLLDQNITQVISGSATNNLQSGDPIEILAYTNPGPETKFNLLIEKVSGPAPTLMKYISFQGGASINEYQTNSPTVYGHPNAEGAITTGAAYYINTPAFGSVLPRKQVFSSYGGTFILFGLDGSPIGPVIRQKPDFTSVDGVNTTFFHSGVDPEKDGFPNFFGTSAAAPHAAGVAALMLEVNPSLSPSQINKTLKQSAIDMDDPATPGFDQGFDFATGDGLIQADKALALIRPEPKEAITHFTLINAETDTEITSLNDGDELNLSLLPQQLNIRATANPDTVGSVTFYMNGKLVRTENLVPYSLGSDYGNGNYVPLNPPLQVGKYELTAMPYSQEMGQGESGNALTIHFTVISNSIAGFTLIDTDTGQAIDSLKNNDELNLALLPKNLNIRAETKPAIVGSVVFNFDGKRVVENYEPYAVASDYGNGVYAPLSATSLWVGKHTLSAIASSLPNGRGFKGNITQIEFSIINEPLQSLARMSVANEKEIIDALYAYPNPFSERITLRFSLAQTQPASLCVYDARGSLIAVLHQGQAEAGKQYEYELSGKSLNQGLYISRLTIGSGVKTQKIILSR